MQRQDPTHFDQLEAARLAIEADIPRQAVEAGARVIEDWADVLDPHALAKRVYSAMEIACLPRT